MFNDTICAIATAAGSGAIAIIRLSGEKAFEIADSVFTSPKNKKISQAKPNTVLFGIIVENETVLDEVLVSVFRAPHSYTGEDSVEISCHGSSYIQQKILELLIKKGAHLAKPGEFTMRAFLNGKMNLAQAEAVADVIASESAAAHRLAMQQMRSGFANDLEQVRAELLHFISLIELELDFAEEDVEFANRLQLNDLLVHFEQSASKLLSSFSMGNAIKRGIPVAIIGEPNVGKSTLLNVLLNEEKAIVSEIAGTTRDVIEDIISLKGIMFRFIDTAGLRETTDVIENLGIERTKEKINQAQIVVKLLDGGKSATYNIESVLKLKHLIPAEKQLLLILNKSDLNQLNTDELKNRFAELLPKAEFIAISAKLKTNIDSLEKALLSSVDINRLNQADAIISNARHYEALSRAQEAANRAISGLQSDLPTDLLAIDIREIINSLGEISGIITNDEILGNIFKNFCIGK